MFFNIPAHGDIPAGVQSGEFDMRGSIVFPVAQNDGDGRFRIEGYAILAGYDIGEKTIRVFENHSFKSITPLYDRETGTPTDRGMVWWFHQAWSRYYATNFYWKDSGLTSRQYKLEAYRNPAIKPSPSLVEVKWADMGAIEQIMWRRASEKTLRFPQALKDDIVQGGEESVAKQALLLVLAGYEKSPWREPSATE